MKVLESLWHEKHQQLASQLDFYDIDANEILSDRVNAEYIHIPEFALVSSIISSFHNGDPDITATIDNALDAIEQENIKILRGAFEGVRFSSLRDGIQRGQKEIFESFLQTFAHPIFDLHPSVIERESLHPLYLWICAEVDAAVAPKKVGDLPFELSHLIATILQPCENEKMYDPVCGNGSALLACGQMVRALGNQDTSYTLCGQDVLSVKQARARVSALIIGENNLNIQSGDFFRAPAFTQDDRHLNKFDIVVAQGALTVDGYGDLLNIEDPYDRFHRGLPPKARGEYVLLSHIAESLDERSGRAAAIFTLGTLFREGAEAIIRKQLIEENLIDAVIELPPKVIEGVPQSTAILILRKSRPSPHIFFINASLEFEPGKSQNRLTNSSLELISSLYLNRIEKPYLSRHVSLEEVRNNNYNLQVLRYIDNHKRAHESHGLGDYAAARIVLVQELASVSEAIDDTLSHLMPGGKA